ncbi:MAG: hypothetical protein NVS2B3_10920 [Vulcanimicrobiaceae bacterium]
MNASRLASSVGAPKSRTTILWLAIVIDAAAAFAIYLHFAPRDAMVAVALAAIVATLPITLYLYLRWPLAVALVAYVLVAPFDSISRVGSVGTLTKLLGIICAATTLFRLLYRRDALPFPRVVFAWLALVIWMAFTVSWAPSESTGFVVLGQYVALLALFALVSVSPVERAEVGAVLWAIVVAGAISSIYQVYLLRSGQAVIEGESRVQLKLGAASIDPNDFASSLVLPIAIAVCFLVGYRSTGVRLGALALLVALAGGLAASGSRGGAIATAAAFLYLIVRSRQRVAVASLLALSFGTLAAINPGFFERFKLETIGEGAGRADIWRTGLRAIEGHVIQGWGIGAFPDAYDATHLLVATHYFRADAWHLPPHNTPLMVLAELGAVGLVLWTIAVVQQFRLCRAAGDSPGSLELRYALEAAFIGVFVAGLTTANLNEKYSWICFMAIVLVRNGELTARRRNRDLLARESWRP